MSDRLDDHQVASMVARLRNLMDADRLGRSDEHWVRRLGLDGAKARQVLAAHRAEAAA